MERAEMKKCSHCNTVAADVREYEGGCGEPVCAKCDRSMRTPENRDWDDEELDNFLDGHGEP